MSDQSPSKSCMPLVWLAALGTLALAGLCYLLLAQSLRASSATAANAALKAGGFEWASFRVADRLGVIDGQAPTPAAAAAARAAVTEALDGKIGLPGVIAGLNLSAGADQLDLRGAAITPVAPPAPPPLPPEAAPPKPAPAKPAPPSPAPAQPAPAAPEAPQPPPPTGARIAGAKACETALVAAQAKRGIIFLTNSARLGPSGQTVVADIAAALRRCDSVRVEVGGHTDVRGSAFANQRLSEARAQAVRAALIAQGVSEAQVFARGYGETRPLSRGARGSDHARNRRISFSIADAP